MIGDQGETYDIAILPMNKPGTLNFLPQKKAVPCWTAFFLDEIERTDRRLLITNAPIRSEQWSSRDDATKVRCLEAYQGLQLKSYPLSS